MAPEDYEALFRHAEATERELTASESLRREADRDVFAVVDMIPKEFVVRIRQGNGDENIYASLAVSVAKMSHRLTPPVAGEGGEG